jgi:hypothetical protein
MKHLFYTKKGITYTPIKYWKTDNITEIAIYQGSRGENPHLDFIVKYKEEGKRLRTPSHTHWIVDLLMKGEKNKSGKIDGNIKIKTKRWKSGIYTLKIDKNTEFIMLMKKQKL